jgi:hypothetical protein
MTLNDYKVRHIRRLKTEISTKLKENEKEGKYVNEAVDNYFEKIQLVKFLEFYVKSIIYSNLRQFSIENLCMKINFPLLK